MARPSAVSARTIPIASSPTAAATPRGCLQSTRTTVSRAIGPSMARLPPAASFLQAKSSTTPRARTALRSKPCLNSSATLPIRQVRFSNSNASPSMRTSTTSASRTATPPPSIPRASPFTFCNPAQSQRASRRRATSMWLMALASISTHRSVAQRMSAI